MRPGLDPHAGKVVCVIRDRMLLLLVYLRPRLGRERHAPKSTLATQIVFICQIWQHEKLTSGYHPGVTQAIMPSTACVQQESGQS